jgi:NAD(P)-dependent dehydrogenase (short-subunit alcohol dehydrogenase family)
LEKVASGYAVIQAQSILWPEGNTCKRRLAKHCSTDRDVIAANEWYPQDLLFEFMLNENCAVIVTGAGGVGCGRSVSARFATGGANVVVSDIDEEGGHETVRLIEQGGGRAAFFRADVRNESQVKELVLFAEETFGGVSVLVNNASAPQGGQEIETWMDSIATDLLGALFATRWAIEAMRRGHGGAVVNIASISALWHGRKTPGGIPGYDVAKAGMIRMTTRLASLARTDGIRVNCLAPGWIATDGVRQHWESLTPEERVTRGVPSRLLTTDQVSEAVLRLAEDRSLAGRVLVWWSEDAPRLVDWGDRGYRDFAEF